MKRLISELSEIEGVKNVKRRSGPTLRINLFSREIPGREAKQIQGDLRKISQELRNTLENADLENWNWIQKPGKKYEDTPIETEEVSDRKEIGHKPAYYTVSIQENG